MSKGVLPAPVVAAAYVGHLRRKLGKDLITSVRGMGYRLERTPTGDEDA